MSYYDNSPAGIRAWNQNPSGLLNSPAVTSPLPPSTSVQPGVSLGVGPANQPATTGLLGSVQTEPPKFNALDAFLYGPQAHEQKVLAWQQQQQALQNQQLLGMVQGGQGPGGLLGPAQLAQMFTVDPEMAKFHAANQNDVLSRQQTALENQRAEQTAAEARRSENRAIAADQRAAQKMYADIYNTLADDLKADTTPHMAVLDQSAAIERFIQERGNNYAAWNRSDDEVLITALAKAIRPAEAIMDGETRRIVETTLGNTIDNTLARLAGDDRQLGETQRASIVSTLRILTQMAEGGLSRAYQMHQQRAGAAGVDPLQIYSPGQVLAPPGSPQRGAEGVGNTGNELIDNAWGPPVKKGRARGGGPGAIGGY